MSKYIICESCNKKVPIDGTEGVHCCSCGAPYLRHDGIEDDHHEYAVSMRTFQLVEVMEEP